MKNNSLYCASVCFYEFASFKKFYDAEYLGSRMLHPIAIIVDVETLNTVIPEMIAL